MRAGRNVPGIVVNLDILPGSPKIAEFVAWRTLANWRSTALGPLSNLGIQLENLEYLRGNTHFIAATTRIPDLLSLGVVRDDLGTVRSTLSASNLDFEALRKLARTIATTVGIPDSAPLSSQHGVQIFDFSARGLCARLSSRLSPTGPPVMPAGDALQNPYWPQGLGINRGFHNAMDAVWSVFLDSIDPSEAEAERSDAFRTMDYLTFTPSCLAPADKWTADPTSRYAFEVYRRRRMEDVELGRETMLRRVREKLGL